MEAKKTFTIVSLRHKFNNTMLTSINMKWVRNKLVLGKSSHLDLENNSKSFTNGYKPKKLGFNMDYDICMLSN